MSLTHTPFSFCTNAPRPVSAPPMRTPWSALQQARRVLKPLRSCTIPKTRTDFALRAAGVLGTCAHARANGAAADCAPAERVVVLVDAVSVAPTRDTATAAPARSQRRLRIGSLGHSRHSLSYRLGSLMPQLHRSLTVSTSSTMFTGFET